MSCGQAGGAGKCREQRRTGGNKSAPSPALLTSYIQKAWTIDELFRTCTAHENSFNHIHISACWNKLGNLTKTTDRHWFEKHAQALNSLVQHTTRMVLTSSSIRARQIATIAHGVAKSGIGTHVAELMTALARSIQQHLRDCNPQELANLAWAFAKASHADADLFALLARAAEKSLSGFNPQELTNTAWAFATAGHLDTELFSALARVVARCLHDFNTQGLANTAWAFAKVGHFDALLFGRIASRAQQRLCDFNSQDIVNTAWAFAKAGQYDSELFSCLSRCAERHVDGFNAQGLANTAWAFAKAGHCDPELFMALQNRMQHRLEDFNSQDIANTAWAFAKACHLDESFFTALARSAELCLNEFNTQDLVNTAWAFAKVGQFHPTLFGLIAQRGAERCLDGMDAPHIANMAWAFARAGQLDKHLFSALARSAEQRVGDFTSQDLANVAWAFTNAGHLEEQLFVALAKAAEKLLDDFDDEDLDNTEWAFTRAGQQRIVQQIRQRRRRTAGDVASTALPNVAVDVSGCGLIVVAGGGIGGAAAAVALQAKGFRVLVLESDSSFESRKQGYGLTIQRLDAAHALGISLSADDAPSTSHYTFSAEGHIINFYGEAFGVKSRDRREFENSGRFVHLPRQALRSRILQKIPPGTIRWNSKFKEFSCRTLDSCNKNGVTVTLTDGTVLNAALLVGSDGIFSTVRRQLDLPGDRLNYVGIVVVLGILDESVLPIPLARRRIFETVNGITRIYVMPFTPSSTMWQLSFPCDEGTARAFQKDASALKVEIMRRCGEWHDPIPDLLCNTPLDCMSGYPVYDRERLEPHGLRSPRKAIPEANVELEPQRRVTLIGDAAHPMTPFKAQGANQALVDAVLLADTLADSVNKYGPHAGFDVALPIFEQKMFTRTARVVIASREKAKELHSSLALQPARKAQRETGLNMKEVIRVLRDKGVVAQCASDPLGLDAVVADAIKYSGLGGGTTSLIAVEDKRFAQGQTELGDRIGEKAKKRKQKNGFSPMREAKRLGKDRSLPSTAAKARKVNEKQPVKEQVSALDAKDGNKSTVNPEVHNLETLTLRLLREAGNQGMRRLKLRKKVLRALTASGVSIKKAAVRERWEKLIGTRPSFKLDGEILYAA